MSGYIIWRHFNTEIKFEIYIFLLLKWFIIEEELIDLTLVDIEDTEDIKKINIFDGNFDNYCEFFLVEV